MPTMQACAGCGAALGEDALFCSKCGKRVERDTSPGVTADPIPPPILPSPPSPSEPADTESTPPNDTPLPSSGRSRFAWFIGGGAAVVVLGLLGLGAWWHHTTTPEYAAKRYAALLNAGKTVEASQWLEPAVFAYVGPAAGDAMYRGQDTVSVIEGVENIGDRGIARRSFRKRVEAQPAEPGAEGVETAGEALGARLVLSKTGEGWRIADCGLILSRALARVTAGQHDEAIEGTTLLRERGCEHPLLEEAEARIFLAKGNAAYHAGAYEKATDALQRSLRLFPLPETHYALGYVYRDNKNLTNNQSRAVEEFREAVRMEPDNAEYHSSLADVYRQLKNYDGAIEEFERSLSLDPSNIQTRYFYAIALLGDDRYSAAARELQRVSDEDPNYRNTREVLALIREHQQAEARRQAWLRQLQSWY